MIPAKQIITAIVIFLLYSVTAQAAGTSAQDSQITITPVVRQFPVTALNSDSTPVIFTITNLGGSTLNNLSGALAGTNPGDFDIVATSCGVSLTGGSSCTISVSFKPTSQGTKSALLQITTDAASTPTLNAYLTNSADAVTEAEQRMPATLATVSIPDNMTVGTTYDLTWTLEGYNASYTSYAVMFDCTGIIDNSCGNSYGDATRFAESASLTPATTNAGDWSYNGVTTNKFTYNWSFTPGTRSSGQSFAATPGTDVVVRFYVKSDIDASRNGGGVSLLIPGNLASAYYDTAGRRITKKILTP